MCGQKWVGKITGEAVSAWSHREHSENSSGLWRHVELRILAKSKVFSYWRIFVFESVSHIQRNGARIHGRFSRSYSRHVKSDG